MDDFFFPYFLVYFAEKGRQTKAAMCVRPSLAENDFYGHLQNDDWVLWDFCCCLENVVWKQFHGWDLFYTFSKGRRRTFAGVANFGNSKATWNWIWLSFELSHYKVVVYVHTLCLRTLQIDDCNHGNCNLNLISKILKSSWCHSCSTNTLQTQVKTQIFMGMLNAHGHDVTHARKTGDLAIIMPRRSLHCIEIQKGDERWFIHNFKDQFHHLLP